MRKSLSYCLFLGLILFFISSASCSDKSNEVQEIRATKLTLKETNLFLKVGNKVKLEVEEYPKGGVYDQKQWLSSNNNIVTVDENGCIEAKSRGKAVVSLITNLGTIDCIVSVDYIPLSSFSITKDKLELIEGDSYQLEVIIEPKDILQYTPVVTFHSSRPDIVEVDNSGLLIANKVGTAVITARVQDVNHDHIYILQEATDECTVIVEKKPEVRFVNFWTDIELGTSAQLKIAYDKVLQSIGFDFFSTDEAIILVNESGTITGVGEGRADVVVRAKDNSCEDRISITVKPFYEFFLVGTIYGSRISGEDWITKNAKMIVSYSSNKRIYISHIELLSDESPSGSALLRQYFPLALTMPNDGTSFDFHLNYERLHDPFLRMYLYDKNTCYVLRKPETSSNFYLEKQYPSDAMSNLFD